MRSEEITLESLYHVFGAVVVEAGGPELCRGVGDQSELFTWKKDAPRTSDNFSKQICVKRPTETFVSG